MKRSPLHPVAILVLFSCSLSAQAALITDINKNGTASPISSEPFPHTRSAGNIRSHRYTSVGHWVYFVARASTSSYGLYKTLGSSSTTVLLKEFNGGIAPIGGLVATNTRVFFSADDGQHGHELWVSDGTPAGTKMVKDINSTGSSSGFGISKQMAVLGNKVIFEVSDPINGGKLWISDGTALGTTLLVPRSRLRSLSSMVSMGGYVLFSGDDGTHGEETWISDGTAAGTKMLIDIHPTWASYPSYFQPLGSKCFFRADDGTHGFELWITDGTSAGTQLVKDCWSGSASGVPGSGMSTSVVAAGKLFFQATDGVAANGGVGLWVSDGTGPGTFLIKDVNPGQSSNAKTYISTMFEANGKVYFAGNDGTHGREPWVSDGTASGTFMLADLYPSRESIPNYFAYAGFGNQVVFNATSPATGSELFVTDGTTTGTSLLMDMNPGTASGDALYCGRGPRGEVFFVANDGKVGTELWSTDGTAAGTKLVANILQEKTPGSSPVYAAPLWNRIVIQANDGFSGNEIWIINPHTQTGTQLIDNYAGPTGGGALYCCRLGNQVVFASDDNTGLGRELWTTDGTSTGTKLLKDLNIGSSGSYPAGMTRWRDKVFFSAFDSSRGRELWVTDGTATGTHLVKDINSGSSSSNPVGFRGMGHLLYFSADSGGTGHELWATDGTTTGTKLIADIRPGRSSSSPADLVELGGRLYFRADDGTHGAELFVSDGTTSGTRLVKDIYTGLIAGDPRYLAVWNGKLWFSANDATHGTELWVSDGTSTGTRLFMDLLPGTASSSPGYLSPAGSRYMYLRASDGTHGSELWRTDSTAAGTAMVDDIYAGASSSSPYMLSEGDEARFPVLWGDVIFRADDGVVGVELYKFANGATATSVGEGYAPDSRLLPTLSSSDPVIGQTVQISGTISSGPGSIPVTLAGVPDYSPLRLPKVNAYSYIDLFGSWFLLGASIQSGSSYGFQFTIPNDPGLKGMRLALQSWIIGTDSKVGFDLSNAVYWWIGN
jgi:ELWxxDGT repeat protein